jgi:hypothetical protein
MMAIAWNESGEIGWTENILAPGGPTWQSVGEPADFSGDIRDVKYIQTGSDSVALWVLTRDGVYYTDNALSASAIQSAGWSGKLAYADVPNGGFWMADTFKGMATYQADADFLIVNYNNGTTVGAVYTGDRGNSWNNSIFSGSASQDLWVSTPYRAITVNENDGAIYACRTTRDPSRGMAAWKSTDGGATFSQILWLDGDWWDDDKWYDYKRAASGSNLVLSGENDRVGLSTDEGASFTQIRASVARGIDIFACDGDIIWACYQDELYKSTNGGGSWTLIGNSPAIMDHGADLRRVTSWPGDSAMAFVSGGNEGSSSMSRLAYTDDDGTTWNSLWGNWGSLFGGWEGGQSQIVLLPRVGANA